MNDFSVKICGLSIEGLKWQINVWEERNCFIVFHKWTYTDQFNGLVRGALLETPIASPLIPNPQFAENLTSAKRLYNIELNKKNITSLPVPCRIFRKKINLVEVGANLFIFLHIFNLPWGIIWVTLYCWFSHDVTKTQTEKLLILLIFNFHDV